MKVQISHMGRAGGFLKGISEEVKDFFRGIEIFSSGGGRNTLLVVDTYLEWLKLFQGVSFFL